MENTKIISISRSKNEPTSRQTEGKHTATHYSPPVAFDNLLLLYSASFVVFGTADLVGRTAGQGWKFNEDTSDELKALLQSIDQKELFISMFVFGNFFLEKLQNRYGQTKKLKSFLTHQVKKKRGGGITQFDDGKPTDFEENEYIHIKETSIRSRHYGQSPISVPVEQIVLLNFIDRYYSNLFDGGMLGTKLLFAPHGAKMTDNEAEQINSALNEKTKGVDNAFDTMIVPFEINKLDIDDISNTEKFLKYREDIIQSIAIALNIPIEILLPQRATRATMAEAIARFNTDIIFPLQNSVMRQLQAELSDEFPDIADVEFLAIDTKNQLQEMEILTGYTAGGIMTANEAREAIGKEPHADGDTIRMETTAYTGVNEEVKKEMFKIQKNISELYEKTQ